MGLALPLEGTNARPAYQLPLMFLQDGFDSNGHWFQWVAWNGNPLSQKTYKRVLIAGSDGFQDGEGCPLRMLSDEAYLARYLAATDWLFETDMK